MWAMKRLNLDWTGVLEQGLNELNVLDEFRLKAYEIGDRVLLFKSRLRLFLSKLKSKWTGPFLITKVFTDGAVYLENKEDERFIVIGQRIMIYLGSAESVYEKNGVVLRSTYPSMVCRSIDGPSMVSVDASCLKDKNNLLQERQIQLFYSSYLLIDEDTNTKQDPSYVPSVSQTPQSSCRATRGTHHMMNLDVVIASQSDEERTLMNSPSEAVSNLEGGSTSGS
ncbi:hypothetical protein EJD97_007940 [Solanum chilense]|uniref:Uncharacterized protein n=1 Tax=Solanum chilense TaxID=4083 RepID=A0A6N2BTP4_SOLCI|nr:hypothetical protein EJD97_007940 [Solanum chilense]